MSNISKIVKKFNDFTEEMLEKTSLIIYQRQISIYFVLIEKGASPIQQKLVLMTS